jgi:hypothetical protein
MTKNDLQTLVAVLDAAQKAGIIAPDAMGLVYQARVSAINLANAMKDTDTVGIVPEQVVVYTGPSEHARPDKSK